MDWFKGKSTGNHRFSDEIWSFPVNFPWNQSIDLGKPPIFRWNFNIFEAPFNCMSGWDWFLLEQSFILGDQTQGKPSNWLACKSGFGIILSGHGLRRKNRLEKKRQIPVSMVPPWGKKKHFRYFVGSHRWGEWRGMAVQPEPQVTDHPCFYVYTYLDDLWMCTRSLSSWSVYGLGPWMKMDSLCSDGPRS